MPCFIAVCTPELGGDSPKQVKEKYDIVIDKEKYVTWSQATSGDTLLAYELLNESLNRINDKKIVVVSEDRCLSSVTINTYAKNNTVTIYISSNPKIFINNKDVSIVYFGIDKNIISDYLQTALGDNLSTYFTIQKIKQIGVSSICNIIQSMYHNKRIHVVIDLQIIDSSVTPSVRRDKLQNNFISINNILELVQKLDIYYLDIIGFDESINDNMMRFTKITGEVCRAIIRNTFNIKENSMNIFTEDSRFLIYRPVEQITNDDIGWYIVKFMTLQERELYLRYLIDKVITVTINNINDEKDFDVLVTSTSIQEQNCKSFFATKNILDYCLFPQEKISMIFELLNTSSIETPEK